MFHMYPLIAVMYQGRFGIYGPPWYATLSQMFAVAKH